MPSTTADTPPATRVLAGEADTRRLAVDLADILAPGDVVALSGDLGSGKTTFARALIRHLAGDEALEVPSPTFTLTQTYDLPRFPVVHVDLYRVNEPSELLELGFADMFEGAVRLIEWPEHAGLLLPADRLEIALATAPELGPEHRRVGIAGHGALAARAERLLGFYGFLEEAGFGAAERVLMQGDASTRMYQRLAIEDRRAVLMIAPRRPDGPPVKDDLPYSAVAHLAEDVTPFVAMARALRERGLSAPEIYAADLADGLLILEDLGAEPVVAGTAAVEERYTAAVDVLSALHRSPLPDTLPVAPSVAHRLPRYDVGALTIEIELLLDWYLPQQGAALPEEARAEFAALWSEALAAALAAPSTWVLRDYHSPNLLWLPTREGIARVGLLDFQDALMGPAAYDMVSLLQDARVDVAETLEDALVSRYMKARRAADRAFDFGQFGELYALMGAQRATKVLGIFARLARRDGKPQYLRHQPRVWRNLRRSLAHPSLRRLKIWYEAHVPGPRPA
jgi:tRNA threonylcarbamoyl adenosine modification protein YjeE